MSVEVENMPVNDADDDSSCGNHSEEGGPNFSDTDPKDSGIDCSCIISDLPDDATATAIRKTVEFYLSDANILKDPFLLKHVRRNKEGYVSLKLLASFRKVRSLSRNWKTVAYSIRQSTVLALNTEETKVRRLTPLPDYDETVGSRSILVHGFSSDKPSVDSISELFSKCGDIALVRILRPGSSIPSDVKHFLSKNPEIQSKLSALVEFEEYAAAKNALDSTLPDGIKAMPIVFKEKTKCESPKKESSPKESPKKKKKNRKSSNADKKSIQASTLNVCDSRRNSSGSVGSQSSGYLSSSPNIDKPFSRRHSYHPSIYNDPNSSFASLSNRHGGSRDGLLASSGVFNPWRRRREQFMQSDSNLPSSLSSTSQLSHGFPVKTIRMPKGPDGTNGFYPRIRIRLPSTAE